MARRLVAAILILFAQVASAQQVPAPVPTYQEGIAAEAGGRPAAAAQIFYQIYKKTPESRDAPYALMKLAEMLVRLGKPADACKVVDELGDAYPAFDRQARGLRDRYACPRGGAEAVTVEARPAAPAQAAAPAILAARAGPRLALVIGNGAYPAAIGSLANPTNDAALMAASLRAVGFVVEVVTDADQRGMKRAIAAFGERLRRTGSGATGLFFYAGHGIQSRGINYLIPVAAEIGAEADLDLEAVAADTVLSQMDLAGAATSIVILDACRNMPLSRTFRSGVRGLARMDAPNGSFVAYSTGPNSVAADGSGRNSPFVAALAQQIGVSGQPIEVTFREVRKAVRTATDGAQVPWDASSLTDTFVFRP